MESLRFIMIRSLPIILVAAGLLYINNYVTHKWDVTNDKLYSLNPKSKELASQLSGKVRIEFFLSEDLPTRLAPVGQLVTDLLRAYEDAADGKITLEIKDPDQDPKIVERANQLGIERTHANVVSDNKMETVELWFGMSFHYEGEREVFPVISDVSSFEYDVSSALLRLTREKRRKILLVGPTYGEGNGVVFDINRDIATLNNEWSKYFDVDQIRLKPETILELEGADALIVWSLPTFTQGQLYAVDQFLVNGGSMLLLASGMRVDPGVLLAQAMPRSRADDFYKHLGFEVGQNLVADNDCTKIKYTNVTPPVLKPYPLIPSLSHATGALSPTHDVTVQLQKLVIPWTSSLSVRDDGVFKPEVIAQTSEQAWLQEDHYEIDPKKVPGPTSFNRYNLGLSLDGPMTSFFKDAPEGGTAPHRMQGNRPASVLVWGSEHLLTQTRDKSVISWALHSASFLTLRGQLSGIDRRDTALRPIRKLEIGEQRRVQWMSILLVPCFLLVFAVVRHLLRSRRDVSGYL